MALDVRTAMARPTPGRTYDAGAFGAPIVAWELDNPANTISGGGKVATVVNRLNPGTYDLTQAFGDIARPTYEATGWGGTRPSMLFNGVGEYMICDALSAIATGVDQPFLIMMAVEIVAEAANQRLWSFGNSASATPRHEAYQWGSKLYTFRKDDAAAFKNPGGAITIATGKLIYTTQMFGTNIYTYQNDDSDLAAGDVDVGAITLDQFTVGCKRGTGTANFSNIRVGGIWVYPTPLVSGAATLGAIRALAHRWNV
jgi:hypothetical protein